MSPIGPQILTPDQVRDIDRRAVEQFGMTSLVLMENAGRGCADLLESLAIRRRVVICCGRGNNGGDGYVLARHLDLRGHEVVVLRWDEPDTMTTDCRANFEIATRGGISIQKMESAANLIQLPPADWYVDALLGTGARGEPRPPYDRVIAALNGAPGRRFAVDVPSGLDCDSGQPASTTIRADVTCTFVAMKSGMLNPAAIPFLGAVHVAHIGVPRKLLSDYIRDDI
jgi:NAD(P)H-hydrate epimerase